jgi:hypothetical protein
MSPTHCPITPLSKIASLTSSSGNTSTVVPRLKAEKDTNTSYKHKHRRTTAICMPNSSSASARSGFRTVPPQPPPRMPSAYASRHSDPDEEGDVPRPLPRSSFGRNSRNHSLRKEENFAKLPVVREKPRAEQTLQRQGVEVFASRYSLDGDTSQDQRLGLTSSRLPRSSSSNWHLHQPSMLRPCAQGNREKSPQRLTTAKLTPFVATATHTSEQPPQEGYLSPLGAENTPIPPVDPNEHIAGSATKPGPANDNVYTSHRQHKRSNAVYIPRSSTDWRLHTYAMLPHPLPTYISRRPGGQEGNAECAPRRLTTTHLSPFATAASPSGPLPSQNERRANVPTGARHTSESSIAITQRQLLQPLGPPIPRSRTMSSLVPAPESITNTRQASPSSSPSSGSPQSSWNPQPSLVKGDEGPSTD